MKDKLKAKFGLVGSRSCSGIRVSGKGSGQETRKTILVAPICTAIK